MLKCDDLAIIEELLQQIVASSGKPSYSWGQAGANPAGTWLDSHGRPSNKVGIPFGLNNGKLVDLWIGNENLAAFTVGIYYHYGDEIGLTLLTSVVVPNTARTKIFTVADFGTIVVPKNVQLAVKVISVTGSPNPQNTGAHATITGTK